MWVRRTIYLQFKVPGTTARVKVRYAPRQLISELHFATLQILLISATIPSLPAKPSDCSWHWLGHTFLLVFRRGPQQARAAFRVLLSPLPELAPAFSSNQFQALRPGKIRTNRMS
jgi:hypothetical protein